MHGWRWRRRRRHGRVGRSPKSVVVGSIHPVERFDPVPRRSTAPVFLELAEVEALRLIDQEKLSFEEAGSRMRISRNTVWRLVDSARYKLAEALVQGRPISIQKEQSG